jgi:hypothetical protein
VSSRLRAAALVLNRVEYDLIPKLVRRDRWPHVLSSSSVKLYAEASDLLDRNGEELERIRRRIP